MDQETKGQVVQKVTDSFRAECPLCDERKGANVWCIINELPPFGFAVGGVVVSLEQVRIMTQQR
ncbi:hypothetical protein [Microvirga roseola]|uniref:hypothetical protein n=1 Tax=Microvirga roseola TaxID=2883126 RepID=UPI001E6453A0|nr:hypothetical protein [Microvirga roseola]